MHPSLAAAGQPQARRGNLLQQPRSARRQPVLQCAQQAAPACRGLQFREAAQAAAQPRECPGYVLIAQWLEWRMLGRERHAGQELVDLLRVGEPADARLQRALRQQPRRRLTVRGRPAALLNHQLVVDQRAHRFHPLPRAVPLDAPALAHPLGEQVQQPLRLDAAGQPNQRQPALAPLLDIHRHQELAVAHGARWRQHRRTPARQQQLIALPPPRHAVWKRGEDSDRQRIVVTASS